MTELKFFEKVQRLDRLIRSASLRPGDLEETFRYLGDPACRSYFFTHLEGPGWIQPLKDKGFFAEPPDPQRDEAAGTVGFPSWPESEYLARMSAGAPDLVLSVILNTRDTENVRVHADYVDAALAMPAQLAAQLLPGAIEWAENRYQMLVPKKLGSLVAHLAKGGRTDAAFELAGVLLDVQAGPGHVPSEAEAEKGFRLPPEPGARFDLWHYERILERDVPELVKADGFRALDLFGGLLEKAIRLSLREGSAEAKEDYSVIWHTSVEGGAQTTGGGIKSLLVVAVRDAALAIVAKDAGQLGEVITNLESRKWPIFKRISLHLLLVLHENAPGLVAERLTDHDLFDDHRVRHEYFLLSQECFGELDHEQQDAILAWIGEGLDRNKRAQFLREQTGEEPSAEVLERHEESWQLQRLHPLRDFLRGEWQEKYQRLTAELGTPEHPEFPFYRSTTWVGPTSPKTADDLGEMTVAGLAEYLRSWVQPDDMFAPSPTGLGRSLKEVVGSRPAPYAEGASSFEGLDPTYVRALLDGLQEACKEGRSFGWPPVLGLCRWVVQQSREWRREVRELEADPHWGWARKAVASLLSQAFSKGSAEIPSGLRRPAWAVLEPITDDPEPTPAYEAEYGGSNMGPTTLSINTVRGDAIHALVRYALWCKRHFEAAESGGGPRWRGLNEVPEAREVLENHLDSTKDPSFAIRSVYGQWFPWLLVLDEDWAKEKAPRIFPVGEEQREYWDAAWEAYIIFCPPYDNVLDLLREQYKVAIDRIGGAASDRSRLADPDSKLAEHLVTFYWRGKVALGTSESLVDFFLDQAPDKLLGEALAFVGRSLDNTKGVVPPAILERLRKLWEARLEYCRGETPASHVKEVGAFGWWFASAKFDTDWALEQLQAALELSEGRIEPDFRVVERLAEIAGQYPQRAVNCLRRIVQRDKEGWAVRGWGDAARTVLAAALSSAESHESAYDLVNELGARGYLEFRDLVSG